jgi:hypothetical protein
MKLTRVGVPPGAALETMLDVAVAEMAVVFGEAFTRSYICSLLERVRADARTAHEVVRGPQPFDEDHRLTAPELWVQ